MNKRGMMINNRGISSIIATLILLLLTIVLVGIVWAVVSGIVKTSTEGANSGAQCFNSAIDVTSATCASSTGNCTITIQRTLGTETIDGVRLVSSNATGDSNYTDVNGSLQTLVPVRLVANNGVSNVTKIIAAIYFSDAAGNKNVCNGVEFTTIQLV
jgi:flagellin-like protein